ncbi:hypothetical protein ZTR_10295 [Talaromyces verruculosus]|nr:hypothetical protein ZTR_10295 [Talaromyces verruculosus]
MTGGAKCIILCLDGTWDNSDDGYQKPTPRNHNASLQVPSNVTRIYRALATQSLDGKRQVMYYHPGLGTTGNITDRIAGGAFGAGISEGLITEIGLLTRKGMENFYPIFKDAENSTNPYYKDEFPTVPFPNKPKPPHREEEYKRRLEEFYDTTLSNGIEYAFQALALDETRTPFAPAVWERPNNVRTDLRQVWFPGSHANVGGGYPDQEVANICMAWMMDQLASIGIGFEHATIDKLFRENVSYYYNTRSNARSSASGSKRKAWAQWAISSIYDEHKPVRPWGLGQIYGAEVGFYHLSGKTVRTPGMYHRINPDAGSPTPEFLVNTNERIHRSVRIRLGLDGLGPDDIGLYKCPALFEKGPWRLRRMRTRIWELDPRYPPWSLSGDPDEILDEGRDFCWVWVYAGSRINAPPETTMIEETLGPYERKLLRLNNG